MELTPLDPNDAWELAVTCDTPTFLRALRTLQLDNGVAIFEGTLEPSVTAWLERNADPTGPSVTKGTYLPVSDLWYLPIAATHLEELAELTENAGEVSAHLFVFDTEGLVIEWYDVGSLPLWIARRIDHNLLEGFANATGGSLRPVPPE